MRIPLDYYQILAVTETDLSQLDRAYQDRLHQLPRQGYSEAAIESRKQLITVAYQVLSDPDRRAKYIAEQAEPYADGESTTTDSTQHPSSAYPRNSQLEIAPEHFVGGLLILFELGEYEEVNSICMPYLGNNGRSSNSGSLHPHLPARLTPSGNLCYAQESNRVEPAAMSKLQRTATGARVIPLRPDIVLTMIFSFLELGDREWRHGCLEEAVVQFEAARKILVQEDLFPQIQGEIERRLDRLRPYRILALVALPLDRHEQRRQGIQFLEELIACACNDEAECQERFGLNNERTVQFIHETLPNLTAGEQRNLFTEVARDSYQSSTSTLNFVQLACTYLQVHALIAQGFAYRAPQSIYTAGQILEHRLDRRLDVKLERAVCALLLGQTAEATQILNTIPESAATIAIRQQSQGQQDLLRGLCWHTEYWLREVYLCFRDLANTNPSIHDYFDDPDVQDFADRFPAVDTQVSDWAESAPQLIDVPLSGDLSVNDDYQQDDDSERLDNAHARLLTATNARRSGDLNSDWQPDYARVSGDAIYPALRVERVESQPLTIPVAIDVDPSGNIIQLEQERQRRRPSLPTARTIDGEFEAVAPELDRQYVAFVPEVMSQLATSGTTGTGPLVRTRRRRQLNLPGLLLFGTSGIACLGVIIWLTNMVWRKLETIVFPTPVANVSPTPTRTKSTPPAPTAQKSPSPRPAAPIASGMLTAKVAQQTIESWLSAKAKSLSPAYQTDGLKNILVEPALTVATERAQAAAADGVHWEYSHPKVTIESLPSVTALTAAATVRAIVVENANYFVGQRLDPKRSYAKTLRVDYNLVRQGNRWYVKEMEAIAALGDN